MHQYDQPKKKGWKLKVPFFGRKKDRGEEQDGVQALPLPAVTTGANYEPAYAYGSADAYYRAQQAPVYGGTGATPYGQPFHQPPPLQQDISYRSFGAASSSPPQPASPSAARDDAAPYAYPARSNGWGAAPASSDPWAPGGNISMSGSPPTSTGAPRAAQPQQRSSSQPRGTASPTFSASAAPDAPPPLPAAQPSTSAASGGSATASAPAGRPPALSLSVPSRDDDVLSAAEQLLDSLNQALTSPRSPGARSAGSAAAASAAPGGPPLPASAYKALKMRESDGNLDPDELLALIDQELERAGPNSPDFGPASPSAYAAAQRKSTFRAALRQNRDAAPGGGGADVDVGRGGSPSASGASGSVADAVTGGIGRRQASKSAADGAGLGSAGGYKVFMVGGAGDGPILLETSVHVRSAYLAYAYTVVFWVSAGSAAWSHVFLTLCPVLPLN